jgi:hypothetical protein
MGMRMTRQYDYQQQMQGILHTRYTVRKQSSVVGGPAQDLSNFQLAPIPILSVPTCSTSSPHDIPKVSKKKLPITLLLGGSIVSSMIQVGLLLCFLQVFD